ncbi:MAG: hypothetical protein IH987_20065, partial [Planctomycetes bacterium]|nr:hypothetical protein [Planctomycetota bacterium]
YKAAVGALKQQLADAERDLTKSLATAEKHEAWAWAEADHDWKGTTAEAMHVRQVALAEAQQKFTEKFQNRWAAARTEMADAVYNTALDVESDGYHVELAKKLAEARKWLAKILTKLDGDRDVVLTSADRDAQAALDASDFEEIEAVSPKGFWDKSSIGVALKSITNFVVGAVDGLLGGLLQDIFEWEEGGFIDPTSDAFQAGAIVGAVALVVISFVVPGCQGLFLAILAVDIYVGVKSLSNIITDIASGNGVGSVFDWLGVLALAGALKGLSARMRGLGCFVAGTGVVMAEPFVAPPALAAGFVSSASGFLPLGAALAIGSMFGYKRLRRKDEEEEDDATNPTRQRGKKRRGVGLQPANEEMTADEAMNETYREIGDSGLDVWTLATEMTLADRDESSVGRNAIPSSSSFSSVSGPSSLDSRPSSCSRPSTLDPEPCSTTTNSTNKESVNHLPLSVSPSLRLSRSPSPSPKRSFRNTCAAIFLCVGLSISGLFFWKHFSSPSEPALSIPPVTQASASPTRIKPIEQVQPGEWAMADNPLVNSKPVQVDTKTWKLVHLQLVKSDGSWLKIQSLESPQWFEITGAKINSEINLTLPELGIFGTATVSDILPCPDITPQADPKSRLVTATYHHEAANVIYVGVEGGEAIGVTDNHPFWSIDRQSFIEAGELRQGESLLGQDGSTTRVVAITRSDKPQPVYNLEVDGEHVYFVSQSGILVHNMCKVATPADDLAPRRVNLNSDDAVAKFGLYEIHINGSIYKVGKANLGRVTRSSGLPTRMHQQVRKLEKVFGKGNVMGKVVDDLGETTTLLAKHAEHARILDSFKKTGFVPLGNWKSFRP